MPQRLARPLGLGVLVAISAGCSACTGCSEVSDAGEVHGNGATSETDDTAATGNTMFVERDGMMQVPAGPFWRGCNPEIIDRCEDDPESHILLNVPYGEIELSEFWIDKYEVTLEAYRACGEAGVCTPTGGISWNEVEPPDEPDLPVTGVSWKQAEAYCAWAGKRLPTEAEWEKAARGADGRRWPWGNAWPECGQAHLLYSEECRTRHPLPVDAHPGDLSPHGVVGMLGNVQEWVQDWAGQSYYEVSPKLDPPGPTRAEAYRDKYKVVRGAYFGTGPGNTPEQTTISLSLRRWGDWEQGYGRIGFRCARSEAPP